MTRFWLGGYGSDMGGAADGIGLLAGDEGRAPTTLAYRGAVAAALSPSWLAQHPTLDVVYAALEGAGTVQAFARSGESTLAPLGEPVEAGEAVCHLAVAPDGRSLIASCYGDGRVVRILLDPAGVPMADAAHKAAALRAALLGEPAEAQVPAGVGVAASDPYALDGEPRASHAHAAAFLPDGRIATTDLGFDLVRIWRVGAEGLRIDHEVVLPRGTGPRHMVVHPSGHLHVVTELSAEVFTLAAGRDGTWAIVSSTTSSLIANVGADFPSELARSRDGETLYIALRGSNTIAALRVKGSGETVEPLSVADSGVDWPRHILVHEGLLLVAGQRSDDITVVDLDERTGAAGSIRHHAPAPAPTHFLPVR